MKSCPTCGASAGDDDLFCEVDGAKLVPAGSDGLAHNPAGATPGAPAAPQAKEAPAKCGACGAVGSDDGDGYCGACGHKLAPTQPSAPGAPAHVGDYAVLRVNGEGDLVVKDKAGASCLLAFGLESAMRGEADALIAPGLGSTFPKVVAQGDGAPLGHYVVLDADADRGSPLGEVRPSFAGAKDLVRTVLAAAEELEAHGFAWEPHPSDLRISNGTLLHVLRLRGARRLGPNEKLNAKKVLEALGPSLVPIPLGLATPGLVRLFLPRSNFSTAAAVTIARAREELASAEEVLAAKRATLAELCDPGLRRDHNEDATAVATGDVAGDPFKVLVVCDGVSSSTHAEQASTIASKVVRDALAHFARSGDILRDGSSSALVLAIKAAHVAVCTSQIEFGAGAPPGTTVVAALVFRKNLTVGWVGDSRAYWVSEQGSDLCTTDHSWVNEAVARGEVSEAVAMQSPLAHALTRCLGPLEADGPAIVDVEPGVRTKALPGPGKLVLCTDGLWNYFPGAPAIANLVRAAGKDADANAIARFLVCQALAQGGGDNVSVAILDLV